MANRLETASPVFGLQSNPLGRLSLIRHLELKLRIGDAEHVASFSGLIPRDVMMEEGIEKTWADFIHQSRIVHGPNHVCFSALDTLKLDFSSWVSGGENLEVSHTPGDENLRNFTY